MNKAPVAHVLQEGLRQVSRMRKILDILASGLGLNWGTAKGADTSGMDTGTRLAQERTGMALERTYWAAERTLMAWIRTALSMISFGFTIGKIGQAVQSVEVKGLRDMRVIDVSSIANLLVILGTLTLLAALLQYSVRVHELHTQGLKRQLSIEFVVAVMLVVLGGFALSSLVMHV
jgi:putative membrane protein